MNTVQFTFYNHNIYVENGREKDNKMIKRRDVKKTYVWKRKLWAECWIFILYHVFVACFLALPASFEEF